VEELMGAPTTSQEGAFRAFNMPVSQAVTCILNECYVIFKLSAPTTSQEGAFEAFNMPVSQSMCVSAVLCATVWSCVASKGFARVPFVNK
jgi:uncharacterized lipoprotein YajG